MPVGAIEVLVAAYREYLAVERGLTADTIEGYVLAVRPFLVGRLRDGGDELDLDGLSAADVVAFVVARCPGQSRGAAKMTVTALRSLLGFLHLVARGPAAAPDRGTSTRAIGPPGTTGGAVPIASPRPRLPPDLDGVPIAGLTPVAPADPTCR